MSYIKTKHENIKIAKSGIFYYVRGRKEISLKTKDEKTALKRKRVIEARHNDFEGLSLKITYEDLKPFYLEDRLAELKRGKIRERTFEETNQVLNWYLMPFFGQMVVSKTKSTHWELFKKSKGLPKDLANCRKIFAHFNKWCVKNGHKDGLLVLDIDRVKRRQRRILKAHEINAIWANAHGSLKVFVALALTMGFRRTEIMTLTWDNVGFENRAIALSEDITKTKKPRVVPMSPAVFELLQDRLKANKKTRWVFPHADNPGQHADKSGLKTAWKTCLKRAFNVPAGEPLPDITWHDLRATCEYYAHKRTDISATQLEKFFGSSVDIQRKIYVSMDADDLRGVEDSLLLQGFTTPYGKVQGDEP